jgi:hypothetical protein
MERLALKEPQGSYRQFRTQHEKVGVDGGGKAGGSEVPGYCILIGDIVHRHWGRL